MDNYVLRKIREKYAEGGLAGVLRGVRSGLRERTTGRLDRWLFYTHKWSLVRRPFINSFSHRAAGLLGFTEAEHQFGRLLYMYQILSEIKRSGREGDIVEFGSYQGFSLYWLARFRDELGLKARVIGIDSFEGLPEASTIWKKGLFSDTSRAACERAVLAAYGGGTLEERGIHIIQGLFNEPRVAAELAALTSRIAAAHVDCDLGSSCTQALGLVRAAGVAEPFYLLFDDWAWHPEEIPASFEAFMRNSLPGRSASEVSSTRFTRYVKVSAPGRAA
jgi:hypothetical protein